MYNDDYKTADLARRPEKRHGRTTRGVLQVPRQHGQTQIHIDL